MTILVLHHYASLCALVSLFPVFTLHQPQIILTGETRSDFNNQPVPGAHIIIKGTRDETYCYRDGSFQLDTKTPFPLTLIIEHPDYARKEITLQKNEVVHIYLTKKPMELVIVNPGKRKTSYRSSFPF